MAETRIEKYKKYRESLKEVKSTAKSDDFEEVRRSRVVTEKTNTTSTLPLDEVLGQIDEDDEQVATKVLNKKKVVIFVLAGIGLLLIAGIIVFAIFAFGGN